MHVLCICIYIYMYMYVYVRIYGYISTKKSLSSLPYFVFIMYHDYIVYLMNCFVYYLCKHILYYVLYYFERRNKSKQTNKLLSAVSAYQTDIIYFQTNFRHYQKEIQWWGISTCESMLPVGKCINKATRNGSCRQKIIYFLVIEIYILWILMSPNNIHREKPNPIFCVRRSQKT